MESVKSSPGGSKERPPNNDVAFTNDGQPLWPWKPKHPEKYTLDRAGLPKREELSDGLKFRKACGLIAMVFVIFFLAIFIMVHFSSKLPLFRGLHL